MYHDVDNDFMRAWQLLHELSEQNAINQKMSLNLHSLTDALKVAMFRPYMWSDYNELGIYLG